MVIFLFHLEKKKNKYDYSFEYAFFDALLHFLLESMLVLKNEIIRANVCGARGLFLNKN